MLNKDECYLELGEATNLAMYCHQVAYVNKIWQPIIGWDGTPVSLSQLLLNPTLKEINNEFPITRAGILKMSPNQSYHWHKDESRQVSINMLLSAHSSSNCLFGVPKNSDNMYFTELKYKSNTLYLFNTQVLHTVINFQETRFLFSVEFDPDITYDMIYNWKRGRVVDGSSLEN